MITTKQKIILAAVALFNEEGLFNVRNADIAEKAGMSLSNFNYHYRTKMDLVFAVFDYMREILEEQVYGNRIWIKGGQGLEITKCYFEFEEQFRFFYLDTHNILKAFPTLRAEMEQQVKTAIQIIKNLNYVSIGSGYMKPEPAEFSGLYDHLAELIWQNNHFWFVQMNVRGERDDILKRGIESNYVIMFPYLTETGKQAYRHFIEKNFGKVEVKD